VSGNALVSARQLERIVACLKRGELPAPADRAVFVAGIESWLGGREPYDDRSLYEALGLALGNGEHDPRAELRRERRDTLYVAGVELMPGVERKARAEALHLKLSAYFASARWKVDSTRLAAGCPYPPGSLAAIMWGILALDPKVLSGERIRRLRL
jgi:hypothetical protein